MSIAKWEDLKPPQKKKIAQHYGWTKKNGYRTLDNWAKTEKSKLVELMVNDFFKTKLNLDKEMKKLKELATIGRYDLLPAIAELETANETSPFLDDELFNRRAELLAIRKIIYGSEL